MKKKEMLAIILAGGQGSRLGILINNTAKPAVTFGGKYRIIDFPLSNCVNSGVDTVGVLTQYQPLRLNHHIGIGIPWDLDKRNGGVTIISPHVKGSDAGEWFLGTANAVFRSMEYIDGNDPEYVLVLSGDHIYKMDYSKMLAFHKKNNCTATIAVIEVPRDEAGRFGIMNTDENDRIYEFEEKPKQPKSNLASMGVYIFTWDKLKEALIADNRIHTDSDFGKHIIPRMLDEGQTMYAYRFDGYWKDVGTIESYWQANMNLVNVFPEFNLYEEFWKIYTNSDNQPPQYASENSAIIESIVSEGSEISGEVRHCVLGPGVVIGEGAVVKDSIIMKDTVIGRNCFIEKAIIDENCVIGENVKIGGGENIPNERKPKIYNTGITVVGEKTVIPENVEIGKNCEVAGCTQASDYKDGALESGRSLLCVEVAI